MSKHAARANLATRIWRHPSTFVWTVACLGVLGGLLVAADSGWRFAVWFTLGAVIGWRSSDFRNIKGDSK